METMTSVSAGHVILIPNQLVGNRNKSIKVGNHLPQVYLCQNPSNLRDIEHPFRYLRLSLDFKLFVTPRLQLNVFGEGFFFFL